MLKKGSKKVILETSGLLVGARYESRKGKCFVYLSLISQVERQVDKVKGSR